MKYIGYIIVSACLLLSGCNEAEVEGQKEEMLTAGFKETAVSVFENQVNGTVEIALSRPASEKIQFRIEVSEETNIRENGHYFISTKQPVIEAGKQSVEVGFTLVDDNVANDARSFCLKILEVPGARIDTAKCEVCVTVLDDESETGIGFASALFSCREQEIGTDAASYVTGIPLTLFGTLKEEAQVTVKVAAMGSGNEAQEGVHYRIPQKTLRFTPGSALQIPVEIINDTDINENREFTVEIASVVGASGVTSLKRCVVTIFNDDLGLSFKQTGFTVEERGNTVRIPIKVLGSLEEAISGTITLGGTAVENEDYTISHDWTIEPGRDSLILELQPLHKAGLTADRTVEVGIVPSAGVSFTGEPVCKVLILDCDAGVKFIYPEIPAFNDETEIQIPVVLEKALEHEVTCRVNLLATQGFFAGQAALTEAAVKIPAGETAGTALLSLKKLDSKQRAWVRLGIDEVYGASSASSSAECRVNKCFKYEAADLTVASFSSQESGNSRLALHAIDGKTETFWHNNYSVTPVLPLPQGIVVGLPDGMHVMAVDVLRRVQADKNQSDDKTGDLYISTDVNSYDGNWGDRVGNFVWETDPDDAGTDLEKHTARASLEGPVSGKYIKIVITGTWTARSFGQIAEVMVYGYTD